MEETDKIMASAIQEINEALKFAVTEHGGATVDLALMAIRVESIGSILSNLLLVIVPLIFLAVTAPRLFRLVKEEYSKGLNHQRDFVIIGVPASYTAFSFLLSFPVVQSIGELLYFPKWAAALGYPEVLLAANALKAAGVL